MTSSRPYLLRAIHEWIVANGCTPHLLVNALADGVQVPMDYVEDDKIVLNVGPSAAHQLELGNDAVTFHGRFGGHPTAVVAPIPAVLAIYARENGQGMLFTEDDGAEGEESEARSAGEDESLAEPEASRRPNLRVIK
jgi:stringent starvation protein B